MGLWGKGDENDERWGIPYHGGPLDEGDRRYVCTRCKQELNLAWVKQVERIEQTLGRGVMVRIVHACPCTAWVRATRYPWDHSALMRLFGGDFTLPWPQAIGDEEGVVDEVPARSPDGYRSPQQRGDDFAHAMDGVHTAQEFLDLCRGPRWRDDEVRSSYWKRWQSSQRPVGSSDTGPPPTPEPSPSPDEE